MPNEIPGGPPEIRYRPSGHAPDLTSDREKREQQEEIKAESGPVIHRIPLSAISFDLDLYVSSQRRQPTIRRQLELLLSGQPLSPVTVMKDSSGKDQKSTRYVLLDGYTTWKAFQRRARLYRIGKWKGRLSQIELNMIRVEIVDGPGHRETNRGLKDEIRSFYDKFPGYPESRAAKELRCDVKTIRKYAADFLDQWKERKRKAIEKMQATGKSSREIAQALKLRWPWARGLSQSAITRTVGKLQVH